MTIKSDAPADRVVRLTLDMSDAARPAFAVEIGEVIDPDRTVVVERVGAFAGDGLDEARELARATAAARGFRLVES